MRALTSKAPGEVVRERAAAAQVDLEVESVGGVDAEKRVAAGDPYDLVVLAEKAIGRLEDAGHVRPGSTRLVLATEAVVAVAADAAAPDVSTPDALRAATEGARAAGISTGPSGDAVRAILDRWGMAEKAVVATPGVPVGSMLVDGSVDIAVQQRTELDGMDGVRILGPLPGDLALTSRFVGAVTTVCSDPAAAAGLLDAIAEPSA